MIMTSNLSNTSKRSVNGCEGVVVRVCVEELLDDAIDRHDLNLREQAHRALDLLDDQRTGHQLQVEQQRELDAAVELGRAILRRHERRTARNQAGGW